MLKAIHIRKMEDGIALKRIFSNEIPSFEEKVKILQGATANNSDNHSAYIIQILEVDGKNGDPGLMEHKQPESFLFRIISLLKQ